MVPFVPPEAVAVIETVALAVPGSAPKVISVGAVGVLEVVTVPLTVPELFGSSLTPALRKVTE
jgi:hypothetical protein